MMATKIPLLKEGYLYKRQRGKSAKNDLRRLKFQQRYMRLDEKTLGYYEDRKVITCNDYYIVYMHITLADPGGRLLWMGWLAMLLFTCLFVQDTIGMLLASQCHSCTPPPPQLVVIIGQLYSKVYRHSHPFSLPLAMEYFLISTCIMHATGI